MALDDRDDSGRGKGCLRATAVTAALEDEAAALDGLCHRLEVQRLLLEQGRADLLARAGRDVEDAMAELRSADLVRAVRVAAAGAAMADVSPVVPTIGRIAAAVDAAAAEVLIDLGTRLQRDLARAVALADENRARLAAARDRLADDELAMWASQWAEEFGRAVDDLHRLVDEPATPERRMAEVESAVFDEEDERLALALAELRFQAIAFDAAVGLLQTVGCRPLLEFIADLR